MSNPIKYSELIAPDSSINDLIKQLEQLLSVYSDTADKIKTEAAGIAASLRTVSGATSEGRKATQQAATDTDRLAKAQRDLAFAESGAAQELARLKEAQREANTIAKLQAQRAAAAEGSYKALSAQYSLNKIILNTMSAAERELTEDGRALVQQTADIYEEMKRLQEATGKHTLNVGNYGQATEKVTLQMGAMIQQLAAMRAAGQQNTAEYQELATKAAQLKDAISDTRAQIKNMASDTSALDSVMGGLSAASGGVAAATGALNLFGAESKDVQEAQRKLQAAIALVNGVTAIQNAVQKQSALMLGLSKIQTAALSKAKAYDRLVTMQGTKATIAATVAQKAFNLVASANPYVLLAVALVTVVGALAAFALGSSSAAKKQERLNELTKAQIEYVKQLGEYYDKLSQRRLKVLQTEQAVARANNKSALDLLDIEERIYDERVRANNAQKDAARDYLRDLNKNIKRQEYLRDLLRTISYNPNITLSYKSENGTTLTKKAENLRDMVQSELDNVTAKIDIVYNIQSEDADLVAERARLDAARLQAERDIADRTVALQRQTEDARFAVIKDSYERERKQRRAAAERTIADIRKDAERDANLTAAQRAAMDARIVAEREKLAQDLQDITNRENAAILAANRAAEDAEIAAMTEGAAKMRRELQTEYTRRIEDLQTRLMTERGLNAEQQDAILRQITEAEKQYAAAAAQLEAEILAERLRMEADALALRLEGVAEGSQQEYELRIAYIQKQRAAEIAANRALTAEKRKDEAAINAKYDAQLLQQSSMREMMRIEAEKRIAESAIALQNISERKKTVARLEAERKRIQQIVTLARAGAIQVSDEELKIYENTLAALEQQIKSAQAGRGGSKISFFDFIGVDMSPEQQELANTMFDSIMQGASYVLDAMAEVAAARLSVAEAAVEAAQKEIDAARTALDEEKALRAAGYANDVATKKKELELAKKNEESALREKERAQKQQRLIDTASQISSLVTAAASIWAQVGVPWIALPLIGVMFASFVASKVMAAKYAREAETYGDGTVELLQGGSHASGNDIDLGVTPSGKRRRAEGGEYFAIVNKRSSRKYRHIVPDVITALNNGTFEEKYGQAYAGAEGLMFNLHEAPNDLRALSDDVRNIREQGEKRIFADAKGNIIMIYKNLKRTVKS